MNIDKLVPLVKLNDLDDEDMMAEAKQEQIKANQRKKRKFTYSFINQDNLKQLTEHELNNDQKSFNGTTLSHFDQKNKEQYVKALQTICKVDQSSITSPDK